MLVLVLVLVMIKVSKVEFTISKSHHHHHPITNDSPCIVIVNIIIIIIHQWTVMSISSSSQFASKLDSVPSVLRTYSAPLSSQISSQILPSSFNVTLIPISLRNIHCKSKCQFLGISAKNTDIAEPIQFALYLETALTIFCQ